VYLKYIGSFDNPNPRTAEEIEAERVALEQEKRERKRQYMREWQLKRKEKLQQANQEVS